MKKPLAFIISIMLVFSCVFLAGCSENWEKVESTYDSEYSMQTKVSEHKEIPNVGFQQENENTLFFPGQTYCLIINKDGIAKDLEITNENSSKASFGNDDFQLSYIDYGGNHIAVFNDFLGYKNVSFSDDVVVEKNKEDLKSYLKQEDSGSWYFKYDEENSSYVFCFNLQSSFESSISGPSIIIDSENNKNFEPDDFEKNIMPYISVKGFDWNKDNSYKFYSLLDKNRTFDIPYATNAASVLLNKISEKYDINIVDIQNISGPIYSSGKIELQDINSALRFNIECCSKDEYKKFFETNQDSKKINGSVFDALFVKGKDGIARNGDQTYKISDLAYSELSSDYLEIINKMLSNK